MAKYLPILLALITFTSVVHANKPLYWFLSKTITKFPETVDFRGCYNNTECVYVSSSPLSDLDKVLAPAIPSQKLWAVADSKNESLSWVFSPERPTELSTTLWISPVSNFRVKLSHFDAKPYLTDAPDPLVAEIVAAISEEWLKASVEYLATNFYTRNSYSSDALDAAVYLRSQMDNIGCKLSRFHQYNTRFSPNVICELPGDDESAPIVVVGAHYDSRARGTVDPGGNERAPGADDNGTGTSGLLAILKAIVEANSEGITFKSKILFVLFSGEEQGLLGSDALAYEFYEDNVELTGMVNLDMIGYPQRNAPTTLYWKAYSTDPALTDLGISLTKVYLGEDTIISTSTSCCSDFQSFYLLGYAATGVFEATAGSNNPNYHQSSDLPGTVTYSHVRRTTQMAAALIATLAEPQRN